MNSEFDILMDIYADLSHNLEHIKSSKNNMIRIKNSITGLDNNYFETKCDYKLLDEYMNMFDSIETYNELINNLDTLKLFIKNKINNICNHEWVHDTIDVDPERSINICYCVKCEVSKK